MARQLLARLEAGLTAAADPGRAPAMRAYLRDQFEFLGVPNPGVRAVVRAAEAGLPAPDQGQLRELALACWQRPEREYQYAALLVLRRHAKVLRPDFLGTARHLIVTKSWWETVDTIAPHVVGVMVTRHPELVAAMDEWNRGDQLWLIRASILHQLAYGRAADADRLFGYCAARADHPDFFIRKAIGWALRQHGRTDPDAVRSFVAAHPELSGLSRREALKHLG